MTSTRSVCCPGIGAVLFAVYWIVKLKNKGRCASFHLRGTNYNIGRIDFLCLAFCQVKIEEKQTKTNIQKHKSKLLFFAKNPQNSCTTHVKKMCCGIYLVSPHVSPHYHVCVARAQLLIFGLVLKFASLNGSPSDMKTETNICSNLRYSMHRRLI
jgi:hypothetical protein